MATIAETSRYVRSKNAGPFWVTIDIFCENKEQFNQIANSPNISQNTIAELFDVDAEKVKMFYVENLNVIKISVPRVLPQGSKYERDMHSGQQYVKILDIEV